MKRFYYSAMLNMEDRDGIIRAESIDSARKKLIRDGFEEISISILSSSEADLECDPTEAGS